MVKKLPKKTLAELLDKTSLDDSFVLGYYGGGNYGDELLFEVLQQVFYERKYHAISFLYQKPSGYKRYHQDLGYNAVDASDKKSVFRAVLRHKKLVIGGGGLWGLDVNFNVLLMSLLMFVARWILGKKVYLVGVGYYDSTNGMGRVAAWLAGKAATQILARDIETFHNFSRINKKTYVTNDIAFTLPDLTRPLPEPELLDSAITHTKGKVVIIAIRRFKLDQANLYNDAVELWLRKHPDQQVVLALMEPREVDPNGYKLLETWQRKHANATVVDFRYNPLTLYRFFKEHHRRLLFVGPQFHVQLVAHLAGVQLMPIVYDNKVTELLRTLQYRKLIAIKDVTARDIEQFVGGGSST